MIDNRNASGIDAQAAAKQEWVTPRISTFDAVTVTKGVMWRLGDGISNLS